jgi:hypothetical protein
VAYWIGKPTRAQAHSRLLHPPPDTHTNTQPCRLPRVRARTRTHKYAFHGSNGFVNALHCYGTRTLPHLLFTMNTSWIDTLFYDSEYQFTVETQCDPAESDIPKASLNEPRTDEMHTKTERLHLIISHVLYYRFPSR